MSCSSWVCKLSRLLRSELHPWDWAELRVFHTLRHAASTHLGRLLLNNVWSALFRRKRHKTRQKIHHGFKTKNVTLHVRIFKLQSTFIFGSKTSLTHPGSQPVPPLSAQWCIFYPIPLLPRGQLKVVMEDRLTTSCTFTLGTLGGNEMADVAVTFNQVHGCHFACIHHWRVPR